MIVAQAVQSILFGEEYYRKVKRVGCYLSMSRGELQTDGIIADLLHRGRPIYLISCRYFLPLCFLLFQPVYGSA
jgi:hypothetical protein